MELRKTSFILALVIAAGLPIILAEPAFAQTPGGVSNVENFIRSVITVLAGLAGLVATGFFVGLCGDSFFFFFVGVVVVVGGGIVSAVGVLVFTLLFVLVVATRGGGSAY